MKTSIPSSAAAWVALFGVSGVVASAASAATRSSANYSITTESTDAGGRRLSGGVYTIDAEAGGVGVIASTAGSTFTNKGGYVGQLYDVKGLALSAAPATVGEGTTTQLGAASVLDDLTQLAINAGAVTWSVDSGPLDAISVGGLATAGIVYQDTGAVARGIFGGFNSTVNLVVKNTNPDNFGTYAGDGIDDAWQVQYFGLDNPNAGPARDPDGDGRTNLQEFAEGTVPTNPASRFQLRIVPVTGQPGQKALIFSPRLTDRAYTPQFRTSLTSGTWAPLTGTSDSDNGQERTVIDLSATGPNKFYRIEVAKP